MKITRLLSWFALSGAVASIVLQAVWFLVNSHVWLNPSVKIALQKITLVVWPSSLLMLAETSDQAMAVELFAMSMLVNAVLYALIGALVWLGLNKHAGFLAALALCIVVIWWRLLTL